MMFRSYYRLVLTDGSVISVEDPWPEANQDVQRSARWLEQRGYAELARELTHAARQPTETSPRQIWLILHQGEIIEHYGDDGEYQRTLRHERYLLLMRSGIQHPDGKSHGIKNPDACPNCKGKGCDVCPEETQMIEILPSQVKWAHRLHGMNDATDISNRLINELNADLLPPSQEDINDEFAIACEWLEKHGYGQAAKALESAIIEEDDDEEDDEPPSPAPANGKEETANT